MFIPYSATYLLEMRGYVLLKVATKGCFWGKKNRKICIFETFFPKQKRSIATEKL